MRLIIMPQALKLVIPGIVNTFIGLFKDTTLVLIIGLFDLLGIVQRHLRSELDFTCNAGDRLCLRRHRLLHLLLRHVALLRLSWSGVSTPATNITGDCIHG
jgi:ABC-type amino acid transport system permease subunit